jgi:hypothetical protein
MSESAGVLRGALREECMKEIDARGMAKDL